MNTMTVIDNIQHKINTTSLLIFKSVLLFIKKCFHLCKWLEQQIHESFWTGFAWRSLWSDMKEHLEVSRHHVWNPIAIVRHWAKTSSWGKLENITVNVSQMINYMALAEYHMCLYMASIISHPTVLFALKFTHFNAIFVFRPALTAVDFVLTQHCFSSMSLIYKSKHELLNEY